MKHIDEKAVTEALNAVGISSPGPVEVQQPKDETPGDSAAPNAMGLAKQLKKAPRAVAEDIAGHIRAGGEGIISQITAGGLGIL